MVLFDSSFVIEGVIPITILIYTIFAIVRKIDGRMPIGIALGLLVAAAVILAFGNEDMANNFAIVCYYFLVSGVVVQFAEYLRENRKKKK